MDETVSQKVALIEDLVPRVLAELDTIDKSIKTVKDLIRPLTAAFNRTCDPVLSQDFAVYKSLLSYKREQLCQILEQDLLFWRDKKNNHRS